MDIKIFVLTNRRVPQGYSKIYRPLYLGTGWKHTDDADYEDTGTNIVEKHELYADLGGFYWIWKNVSSDIVGISQYRKYFFSEKKADCFIQSEEILSLLSSYDILIPPAFTVSNETVYDKYKNHMHIEDLHIARDILKEKYPDCLNGFDFIMSGCRIYGLNMWIARKTVFDKYCAWVFPILQEAEKKVHIENYSQDMKRVLAFLSEYLFSVWLIHEKLRVYELAPRIICDKGQSPAEELIRQLSRTAG